MNKRENFLAILNFEKPGFFPIMEFMGFWPEVVSAWNDQGQKFETTDEIFEHFGLMQWKSIPIDFNFIPPFKEKILEETKHHIVMRDSSGCTKKIEKNSSAMPHYIEFPIKSRDDFEALKERLDPLDYTERYPANWPEQVKEYRKRDYPLGLLIRGPFAFCRDFIHFERLMMLPYDNKEFVRDMMKFQKDFIIHLFEKAVSEVEIDFLYLGEDMAYKTSSMFSPGLLNELIKPLYTEIVDYFKSNGIKNIIIDSDGCINDLLPMFVEAGITGILPIERAAGMDPIAIREKYPKLQMIGGVDKLKIAGNGQQIDEEIEMVRQLLRTGGYIPSFDHSVPPIVSYRNYKMYQTKLKKLI